ncbi:MAG: hypothetical protein E6907_09775, partial [Limosilactobacillus vaginalis]|nr:hypothetical protein [Limosilactobacillus vaginalis]
MEVTKCPRPAWIHAAWSTAAALCVAVTMPADHATAEELSADRIKAAISAVDSTMIKANTATSKDWPTIGLDYAETRFSRLDKINTDNVKDLGLAW